MASFFFSWPSAEFKIIEIDESTKYGIESQSSTNASSDSIKFDVIPIATIWKSSSPLFKRV